MKHARLGIAVLVGLGLATGGCKKLVALAKPPAPLVDTDYQFRLEAPGRNWTLLGPEAAKKLVPDAVAGANLTGAGMKAQYGVILVESYPGDLAAYAQLIHQALQIEDKHVEARTEETFAGRPAIRITTRGARGGVKLRFQHLLFLHQGFGYQLVSWGLQGELTAEDLKVFSSAFHRLEGPVRARRPSATVTDARGPGWRLVQGHFQSAAWGIAATPTAESRVVVGKELAAMNASAEVGLAGGSPEGYVVVLPEVVPPEVAPAIAEERQQANVVALGLAEAGQGFPAQALGETVSMRKYLSKSQPIVYFQGAVIRGGRIFILLAWQMKNAALDAGGGELGKMLGGLRLLDEPEREQVRKALSTGGSSTRQVGTGFALHRGLYRNFDHGFSWNLPGDHLRIHVGDAAREQAASALLVFDEAGTGLGGMVSVTEWAGKSASDFHAQATGGLFPGPKKGRASGPQKLDLPGGPALVAEGQVVLAKVPMLERVVTWVRGNQAYRAIVWGARSPEATTRERFDAVLGGLRLATEPAVSVVDGRYVNRRLGFSYAPPAGPDGKFERAERVPPGIASIGSIVEWKNRRHLVAVMAIFDMESRMDEESVLKVFRPSGDRAWLTQATATEEGLGGVMGKRLRTRRVVGGDFDLVLVRRHGVFYGIILETLAGKAEPADLEAFKAGFQFLD